MTPHTHSILDNDALETPRPRRSTKYFRGGLLLIALALFSSGCERGSASTPAEMLVGRWKVTTNVVRGADIPGDDGSYLEFDACDDDECTGTDHMGSNATTGGITYALAADGRAITITDTTTDGGAWGGTWTIIELNQTEFHIGIDTGGDFLRAMIVELERVQ